MPHASFQPSWSTIARTCAISSSVAALRARGRRRPRGTRPSGRGRRSSTRACRARRRRRDRDRARAGRRRCTARRSSRARPGRGSQASCARARAGRGCAPAAPPPTCRRARGRRPRRAARTRGSSSATSEPGASTCSASAVPREQLLAARRLHRLPDLARRLALEPGGVREHPAERRPVRALGQVRRQRVVERELARVAQLHDRRRP